MRIIDNFSIKLKSICNNEVLAYTAYALLIASDIFNNIQKINLALNVFDVISVCFFILVIIGKILTKTYKIDRLLIFLLFFFLLSIPISLSINNRSLIKLSLFLIVFKDFDFNSFIQKDLKIRVILVVALFLLFFSGIATNGILEYRNGFMRNAFGSGHPNEIAMYLSIISIEIIYIAYINKHKIMLPLIFGIANLFFNHFFLGSRSNFILLATIMLVFVVVRKIKINNKIMTCLCSAFIVFLVVSLVLGYFYTDNTFFSFIDKLFSKRIFYTHQFLETYNINLFGNNVISGAGMILDNAYINIILRYGILITFFFTIIFTRSLINLKHFDLFLFLIFLMILCYGLVETPIYIVAKNPFILVLSCTTILKRAEKL